MKKRKKQLIALSLVVALFLGQLPFTGAGIYAAESSAVSADEAAADLNETANSTEEALTDKEPLSDAEVEEKAAENAEAADESLEETEAAVGAEETADLAEGAESSSGEEEAASGNEAIYETAGQNQLTENSDKVQMVFKDGMAQPIIDYSVVEDNYSNENSDILRFSVFVETDLDTDMDGKNDLVEAMIQVPRAAAEGDYKAPAIFEASPYFGGTTDIFTSWPNDPYYVSKLFKYTEEAKIEGFKEADLYQEGSSRSFSVNFKSSLEWAEEQDVSDWYYYYNLNGSKAGPFFGGYYFHDYYLIRGFAIVTSAGLGTHGSEGLETCGSRAEAEAFKNIIEWIQGDRKAYTDKTSNIPIKADWSNGKVAMTGTSYDGTLAYEVATSGVKGLKTVVPVGAIASWYEYTNEDGQANYPNHSYQYWLSSSCGSRFFGMSMNSTQKAVDDGTTTSDGKSTLKLYEGLLYYMNKNEQELLGQYGDYWKNREFSTAGSIKVPGLLVEGLQDWNVRPKQTYRMKKAFENSGQLVRVLLHQDGHTDPDNIIIQTKGGKELSYDQLLNLWYSKYLCGQDNKIDEELAAFTVQSNVDGAFYSYKEWGSSVSMNISSNRTGSRTIKKIPRDDASASSAAAKSPRGMQSAEDMYYDINSFYRDLPQGTIMDAEVGSVYNDTWVQPVYKDVTINGMPKIRLKVKADSVSVDMLVGAMLYDVSDKAFDSFYVPSIGTLDRILEEENYFLSEEEDEYFKRNESNRYASYSRNLNVFKTTTKYNHLITKGKVSLKCTSGNGADFYDLEKRAKHNDSVSANTYYYYDLYLNPTVYTVEAGHRLVVYLMGSADGVYSGVDATIDYEGSSMKLPVILNDGVSLKDVTGFEDGLNVSIDYGIDYNNDGEKETRTEKIEGKEVSTISINLGNNKTSKTSKIWVRGVADSYIWQGKPVTLDDKIRVYDGIDRLTQGTDYKLSYKNHKKVGSKDGKNPPTVTIKFIGEYKNNAAVKYTYNIEKADLSLSSDIVADDIYIAANGKNQKPLPDLIYTDTNRELPKNQISVTYRSGSSTEDLKAVKEPGEYTLIVRAKNAKVNVKGERSLKLTVLSADDARVLSNAKVTLSANKFVFTNDYITPEPTVIIKGINNDQPLPAEAISVSYINNFLPGNAKMVIKAAEGNKLGLAGSTKKTFKIVKGRKITDDEPFSFTIRYAYYTMGGGKPDVTVKDGDDTLTLGKDYTLGYSGNNKITDSAKVTIIGKGNYKGSVRFNYTVKRCSIGRLSSEVSDKFGDLSKENGYKNPSITVTDINGKKLRKNRDYTIDDSFYSYDPSSGSCSLRIRGKGKYNGYKDLSYRYMDKKALSYNLAKAKAVSKIADQTYSLGPVFLSRSDLEGVLKDKAGTELTPGVDFNVDHYVNNSKAGNASIVLKGTGKYAGMKTLRFKITDGKKRDFLGWLIGGIFK